MRNNRFSNSSILNTKRAIMNIIYSNNVQHTNLKTMFKLFKIKYLLI